MEVPDLLARAGTIVLSRRGSVTAVFGHERGGEALRSRVHRRYRGLGDDVEVLEVLVRHDDHVRRVRIPPSRRDEGCRQLVAPDDVASAVEVRFAARRDPAEGTVVTGRLVAPHAAE